ncbi:MAG: outer membrane lipid asymmetry maintenance protein MlaD [Desulfobacterales bacterium]|jgi:phospholipid/cholesterol/gamma-HCH transport system substrate-binding protein
MKKYSKETVVGIFVVAGLVCIGYMTIKLGNVGILDDDTYALNARFNRVTGLREGNPVNMLGLEIGRVANFKMVQDEQAVIVEMRINKGIKIYDDALAAIKIEGLIGDRYMDIAPGGAGELLKPGETITETQSPTDLNELIGKYAFGDVKK